MSAEPLSQQLAALHTDSFGWARHCCRGDTAMAEEVMQNAYLKCLQGRLREPDPACVKSWWLEVIRRTALEELRRRRSLVRALTRWFASGEHELADTRSSPELPMEFDEEASHLQALLARLPARQSEVLHLVFYQGLTISEAAAVMNVGVGTARRHYERGKGRLREWLETEART